MLFDLLVFDCDGVLVDSERHANRVYAEALAAVGVPVTAEQIADWSTGIRHVDLLRVLERETGFRPPEGYLAGVLARLREAVTAEGEALAVPGIHQALDGIGDRPCCVASGSSLEALERMLGQTRLWPRFVPHVFSAHGMASGKPAPDLFLHAARIMGVQPTRCLVIEDSVPGVTAGIAAGMQVVGFTGTAPDRERAASLLSKAGAHHLLNEIVELPDLIARLEQAEMTAA